MTGRWTVKGWMADLASAAAGSIAEVRGYPVTAQPGSGPRIFVTLSGATGDNSATREAKEQLEALLAPLVHEESPDMSLVLRAVHHADDAMIECEVIFP